jgi:hypothetical protein
VAKNIGDEITTILATFCCGTKSAPEKRGRGRPKSDHWRLDFSPNNGIIRARLRRGSGRNRANVKDENGIIIKRNFVPLGTIEDVYENKKFKQWQKRCEEYCRSTDYNMQFGGAGDSHADSPAETGVAGIALNGWRDFEIYQSAGANQ